MKKTNNSKSEKCNAFSEDIYDDYIENVLSEEEMKKFEGHFSTCPHCLEQLREAIKIDEQVNNSYLLSEIGEKKSLDITMKELDKYYKRKRQKRKSRLLAAAGGDIREKAGSAFGIAIDKDTGEGSMIECEATLRPPGYERGVLEIRGPEVEEYQEYSVKPPLELLEERLEDIFEYNPYLKPFKLWEQNITVDVSYLDHETGYIIEAESLALAIIMAVLNAATEKKEPAGRVYSAGISQDGRLKSVGYIKDKIKILEKGNTANELILSEKNKPGLKTIGNQNLSVLFFEDLGDILDHFDFFSIIENEKDNKEQNPVTNTDYIRRTNYSSIDDYHFITRRAEKNKIKADIAIELCELAEDLCQRRPESKPISSAFIVGTPEKIENILPSSPLKLKHHNDLVTMREVLINLSSIVDGISYGFLIGKDGMVDSIRRVNIDLNGEFPISKFLKDTNRRYAIISKITNSMIFFVSSGNNRVDVFDSGRIIGRYKYGYWLPIDYDKFEKILTKFAAKKNILPDVIEKAGRTAIQMVDQNEGGIFVIFNDKNNIQERISDPLKQMPIKIEIDSVRDISDDELINFAREDGAVLIDNNGHLHTFMAFLKPKRLNLSNYHMGTGTRHYYAQLLSKDIGCLCIVVSQDGQITVFGDGQMLYKI